MSQLAKIEVTEGPAQISRDMAQRRIIVSANVTERDLGGFVKEAKQKIDTQVKLPTGYLMTWGGQFENQQRAMKRFSIVVPITIAGIFLLLFSSFNSVKQALLIIMNIPFALIGGILALVIGGFNLSVSASVGFIALFGVAVLNGVVMVSYFNELRREGLAVDLAVIQGSILRLRPVLITASVAALGLIPMLFAKGPRQRNSKAARRRRHWRPHQFDVPHALHSADALQGVRTREAARAASIAGSAPHDRAGVNTNPVELPRITAQFAFPAESASRWGAVE